MRAVWVSDESEGKFTARVRLARCRRNRLAVEARRVTTAV